MEILKKPEGHYVYVLYDGDIPVYVGKGSGPRVLGKREFEWDGYKIVIDGLDSDQAFKIESSMIESYGIDTLYNKPASGGRQGYTGPRKENYKANMREVWRDKVIRNFLAEKGAGFLFDQALEFVISYVAKSNSKYAKRTQTKMKNWWKFEGKDLYENYEM